MSRKLLMNTDDPYNIDGMKVMTKGKMIDWSTYQIIDNPDCWATVDAVTVVSGRRYRITADAILAWVISYDDDDKYYNVTLSGNDNNPQDLTFKAETNHIRFGIYDPKGQLTYFIIKAVR